MSVVVANDYSRAQAVDEGHPAYHLPSVIRWPSRATRFVRGGGMWINVPIARDVFRRMTPRSPGWRIPARPGLRIAERVAREETPNVAAMVADAVSGALGEAT